MCLSEVKRGQRVTVSCIQDEGLRTQLIRFGIGEGSHLTCVERIPYGPFMMKHNRQEIAIGREVAKQIVVQKGCRSCK
jgi:ferrous iron transport protein A